MIEDQLVGRDGRMSSTAIFDLYRSAAPRIETLKSMLFDLIANAFTIFNDPKRLASLFDMPNFVNTFTNWKFPNTVRPLAF